MRELGLLALAAALEVGGDAFVRIGLKQNKPPAMALGAAVLFLYGLCVNLPDWDFSRLMGVYIAVFFVVSQLVAVGMFAEKIKPPMLVGGALIVAGGIVMTFWKT